ncbi:hypothetical protein AAMO2058_001473400 [Amorphochlora amoebiformis]
MATDRVLLLEEKLKRKLRLIAEASPHISSKASDLPPPDLSLNSGQQPDPAPRRISEEQREAVKMAKKLSKRKSSKRNSGATSLSHLKFLMTHNEDLKVIVEKSRREAIEKYDLRSETIKNSYLAVKKECDEDIALLRKKLSRLLDGCLLEIPNTLWLKRTDTPPNGPSREILTPKTLQGGILSIRTKLERTQSYLRANSDSKLGEEFRSNRRHSKGKKGKKKSKEEKRIERQQRIERAQQKRSGRRSIKTSKSPKPPSGKSDVAKSSMRRRDLAREEDAKTLLGVFPYLTKAQAIYALRQRGSVQSTTEWLLSKDPASLDWANHVKDETEANDSRRSHTSAPTQIQKQETQETVVAKVVG